MLGLKRVKGKKRKRTKQVKDICNECQGVDEALCVKRARVFSFESRCCSLMFHYQIS